MNLGFNKKQGGAIYLVVFGGVWGVWFVQVLHSLILWVAFEQEIYGLIKLHMVKSKTPILLLAN